MNDSLQEKIKKLHLAGILQTADMRAEQAAKEQMSYMEFLELLINDENLNRSVSEAVHNLISLEL